MTNAVNIASLGSAMTATSAGNVGIGTTPSYPLDVRSASTPTLRMSRVGTSGQNVYLLFEDGTATVGTGNTTRIASDSGAMSFSTGGTSGSDTGGTERMRINSSGYVTTPYQPAFQVYNPGTNPQSGVLIFTTVQLNIGSCYNSSNGRFTAPVTGIYYFSYQFLMSSSNPDIVLRINGGNTNPISESYGGPYNQNSAAQIVSLSAGDYVQVNVVSGTAYGGAYNNFSGYLLG